MNRRATFVPVASNRSLIPAIVVLAVVTVLGAVGIWVGLS